jgi:hypothetical protein
MPRANEDYSHLEIGLPQMSFSLMKMSNEYKWRESDEGGPEKQTKEENSLSLIRIKAK